MTNPLLQNWDTPFKMAPFDQIDDTHFEPAFEAALKEAEANIRVIAENPAPPDFANTIEALEVADKTFSKVLSVFFTLAGADSNPERQRLQREFSPRIAGFSSETYGNKALFARICTLWEGRDALDLTPEQARVLMLTHRAFRRAGAGLSGDQDVRMRAIMARLAELGTGFTQNLLADEAEWLMPLAEDDLKGLPDFVVEAARAAGAERDLSGPVITLSRSLIVPFLQFSPRRDLRERALGRGPHAGQTAGIQTTAPSQPRHWPCAPSVQNFWVMTVLPISSWRRKWPAHQRLCASF